MVPRQHSSTGSGTGACDLSRSTVPSGQTDSDPADVGDWESSGILDVTHLFATVPGEMRIVRNVQADSIRDGPIKQYDLVQGGQLLFFSKRH